MAIALECGIVFTVPGVASLALAGLLNVPLGKMLLFGLLLVIPTIIISIAIMTFLFRRGFWNEAKDEDHTFVEEEDRKVKRKRTTAAPRLPLQRHLAGTPPAPTVLVPGGPARPLPWRNAKKSRRRSSCFSRRS